MIMERFILPNSYQIGKTYFYRNGSAEDSKAYTAARLLFYRPHPAELVVEMNGKKRLIHRRFLYSRSDNPDLDKAKSKSEDADQ
jgi:hypothetical protein